MLRNTVLLSVIINIVGDYVSLGQTRIFLRWAARAPFWLPLLTRLDAVLTLAIYVLVILAAMIVFTLFGLPIPALGGFLPDGLDTARWLPAQWIAVFSVLTTMITSVWLWLVLLLGPLARLVLSRNGGVTAIGRWLGVQSHPFTALGLLTGAIIAAVGIALPQGESGVAASSANWEIISAGDHCAACPEMVVLPRGEFVMGSPGSEAGHDGDESPQRAVTIDYGLAVGRYEVTWAEWNACVADGGCNGHRPSDLGWDEGRRPVINVSWHDTQAYVAWLNSKVEGMPYRLLSEADWEYAAWAGTTTVYSTGETITARQANFGRNIGRTVPVGSYAPNPFGLYDMHGNVWEWVADCRNNSHQGAPTDGSAWTTGNCSGRVGRGGSWDHSPQVLRSTGRVGLSPELRNYNIGFRLARTL